MSRLRDSLARKAKHVEQPWEFARAPVREQLGRGQQGERHEAADHRAGTRRDTRRVDGDGPDQRLDLTGPLVAQTPQLQAVPAHTSVRDELVHLGLTDQARNFAKQAGFDLPSAVSQRPGFCRARCRLNVLREAMQLRLILLSHFCQSCTGDAHGFGIAALVEQRHGTLD